jgi:parallel beta-helix repeat protein
MQFPDDMTHRYCSLYEQGGAVDFDGPLNPSFLTVTNTIFTGNIASSSSGGGLFLGATANIDMEGCAFSGNRAVGNVRTHLLIEIAGWLFPFSCTDAFVKCI